jgi:hypothetical protein
VLPKAGVKGPNCPLQLPILTDHGALEPAAFCRGRNICQNEGFIIAGRAFPLHVSACVLRLFTLSRHGPKIVLVSGLVRHRECEITQKEALFTHYAVYHAIHVYVKGSAFKTN